MKRTKGLGMFMNSVLALLTSMMLCSSCATIISGSTAKIHIDGNVDEPVTIATTKDIYKDLTLPATVEVKRRSLDGQHIQIYSENYAFSDIVLRKSVNSWSILDALFYGVPLIVDLMTNAASVPEQSRFFVTPDAPRSQADSLHRADSLRLARAEEELLQKRLQAQLPLKHRHELRGSLGFGSCQASHDKDKLINSYLERYDLEYDGECFDLIGDAYVQAGLEYHYRLNRKWDIGLLANWGISREDFFACYYSSEDANSPITHPDEEAIADEFCRFFVVAPSVRYTWYEIEGCRCYSRIALGAMRHHLTFDYKRYPWVDHSYENTPADMPEPLFTDATNKIKWRMAYQLTPVGISFGSDSSNLFGELGYGSLGVVRFGVAFMF